MKSFLTIVFFAITTTLSFAQKELDNKTIHGTFEIQPEKDSPEDKNQLIIPKKEPLPPIAPKDENPNNVIKPFSMIADDNLMDSGEELERSWYDGQILDSYKVDQNLGSYRTTSTFLKIECRDFGAIDGDRVRIMINGVLVEPNMFITGDYKGIKADLIVGENIIEFTAMDVGVYPPNTARVRILSDDGNVLTRQDWNLMDGVKATLIVNKHF